MNLKKEIKIFFTPKKSNLIVLGVIIIIGLITIISFCKCQQGFMTKIAGDECRYSINLFLLSLHNILYFPSNLIVSHLSFTIFPEGSWWFSYVEACDSLGYTGPKYFPILFWMITILFWYIIVSMILYIYIKIKKQNDFSIYNLQR